jgi:hypothetical protein
MSDPSCCADVCGCGILEIECSCFADCARNGPIDDVERPVELFALSLEILSVRSTDESLRMINRSSDILRRSALGSLDHNSA